jgi:hypothetical protein
VGLGTVEDPIFLTGNKGFVCLAKPRSTFDQSLQHGLQVEGRSAYDLEHIGGGGLLLQRFGKFVCAPA